MAGGGKMDGSESGIEVGNGGGRKRMKKEGDVKDGWREMEEMRGVERERGSEGRVDREAEESLTEKRAKWNKEVR